jgi:hypothetical protein
MFFPWGAELLGIRPAINYSNEGGKDMKRMTFRKVFLLSGILILSVLFLGQLGWACDEPDHPYHQCTEEPDIKEVKLDYDNDLIYIYGKNFKEGTHDPVVTLGDIHLSLKNGYTGNEIVAIFPAMEAGDYKLVVSTGETRHCKDKQSVKIAHDNKPSCPQPPQTCPAECKGAKGDKGDTGDTGPVGPQGPPGKDGKDGKDGIDGKDGANGQNGAAGAAGPQGAPGITGWQIVEEVVEQGPWEVTALCETVNGYVLTGGGFEAGSGLSIIVSIPLKGTNQDGNQIGIGWKVVAEPISDFIPSLKAYAVCACVNPNGCK